MTTRLLPSTVDLLRQVQEALRNATLPNQEALRVADEGRLNASVARLEGCNREFLHLWSTDVESDKAKLEDSIAERADLVERHAAAVAAQENRSSLLEAWLQATPRPEAALTGSGIAASPALAESAREHVQWGQGFLKLWEVKKEADEAEALAAQRLANATVIQNSQACAFLHEFHMLSESYDTCWEQNLADFEAGKALAEAHVEVRRSTIISSKRIHCLIDVLLSGVASPESLAPKLERCGSIALGNESAAILVPTEPAGLDVRSYGNVSVSLDSAAVCSAQVEA